MFLFVGLVSHKCDICGKALGGLEQTLKDHVDTVNLGIKERKCDLCGERFAYGYVLKATKRHIKPQSRNDY